MEEIIRGAAILGFAFGALEMFRAITKHDANHDEKDQSIVFVDPKTLIKTGDNILATDVIGVGGDTGNKKVVFTATGAASVFHNTKPLTQASY